MSMSDAGNDDPAEDDRDEVADKLAEGDPETDDPDDNRVQPGDFDDSSAWRSVISRRCTRINRWSVCRSNGWNSGPHPDLKISRLRMERALLGRGALRKSREIFLTMSQD